MPLPWILAFFALSLPPLAHAAKSSPACESQAQSLYKQNTTVVEMSLIVDNLNEVEVARAREGLQKRLQLDQADCQQQFISATSRSRRLARARKNSAF